MTNVQPEPDVVVAPGTAGYEVYTEDFRLVAEILSPSNTRREIDSQLRRYREAPGNLYAVVIEPRKFLVEIHAKSRDWQPAGLTKAHDPIDMPEFDLRCRVADLYRGTPRIRSEHNPLFVHENQHRSHSHHAHRQPAAAEAADRSHSRPGEGPSRSTPRLFEAETAKAVDEIVAQQVAAGIDIVSDGEMSKPSYTTYIRHRVEGIEPDPRAAEKGRDIMIGRDLLAHPDFAGRRRNFSDAPFPGCVGPLRYKDRSALDRDLAHLKAAAAKSKPADVFMTAPSPGILTRFIINLHYPSEDAYVEALAEMMKTEYRAIVEAGFVLQIDAPDLGSAATTSTAISPTTSSARSPSATSRRSTPRPKDCLPTGCGCTSAGATTRGRTISICR